MDQNDQDDIIKKVKTAGDSDNEGNSEDMGDDMGSDSDNTDSDFGGDGNTDGGSMEQDDEEGLNEASIFLDKPKKNNMFQPGSNDKLTESCWKGYKQIGMKEKDGKEVPNCVPINENVGEHLNISEKNSIFVKIKTKLKETFNQEETMSEPMIEPQTQPVVKPSPDKVQPNIAPSRKNKPFLPMPEVKPDPKAVNEGKSKYEIYHKTLSQTIQEIERYIMAFGYEPVEFDINDIQHVPYGQTARIQKPLIKNGKQRGNLNAQIYRMDGGTYELNMYVG